jgi:hypothetical protein
MNNPDLLVIGGISDGGDAVHANARGCQIIGRLLEIWFRE